MKTVILLLTLIGISLTRSCSGSVSEPIYCIRADVANSDNKCCYVVQEVYYTNIHLCEEFPKDMKGDEIIRTYGYYKVICNGKFMKARLLLSLLLFLVIFFK